LKENSEDLEPDEVTLKISSDKDDQPASNSHTLVIGVNTCLEGFQPAASVNNTETCGRLLDSTEREDDSSTQPPSPPSQPPPSSTNSEMENEDEFEYIIEPSADETGRPSVKSDDSEVDTRLFLDEASKNFSQSSIFKFILDDKLETSEI